MRLNSYSFKSAEQVLNSKPALKHEIEKAILDIKTPLEELSRPKFNEVIHEGLTSKGWQNQSAVFNEAWDSAARMDFLKERIGVGVEFSHSSFWGIDLLKFQASYNSGLNKIDAGVYIVTTINFQGKMTSDYKQNWRESLDYERVIRYLPNFKSTIHVPIFVMGIDL
jgi:hypothetical protein